MALYSKLIVYTNRNLMPNIISILKNNLRCQFMNESLMLDTIFVPNVVRPFENTLSSFMSVEKIGMVIVIEIKFL